MIVIAWEVTSAIALVIAALYFILRYLKMGLTTIPEFLESRFDKLTRTLIYYFRETFYDNQDAVYPELVKKGGTVLAYRLFAAVVMGTMLSTFNSVLNSAATLFSIDIYKQHIDPQVGDRKLVRIGKTVSATLALTAIVVAPLVANAPAGLYQLRQELNGIFFIPIASILQAGFFYERGIGGRCQSRPAGQSTLLYPYDLCLHGPRHSFRAYLGHRIPTERRYHVRRFPVFPHTIFRCMTSVRWTRRPGDTRCRCLFFCVP